ncbi:TonB-dependent receptor plug domain-containing protein [Pseudomonadota bacterium]
MPNKKRLSHAISTALGFLAIVSIHALAQDDQSLDEDELILEEVVVTGSRIKRTMDTQSQETITFTAEQMNIAGDVSVSEALRSSTMNSIGSFRESSGNTAQSNATLNLRGVGESRSLVLLNGRRAVGSPSLGGGSTFNLNMIPFSAVDRIEVIADGASAVYGSDAIAGVVNVILKKNYDGMTIQVRYGDRQQDDGTEVSASILMGASNDRASITFALEYDKRDPIFDADRDYTKATWGDLDGDGDITGYEETRGVSYYGYTLLNPDFDRDVAYDPNDRSTWYVTPGTGCVVNDVGFVGELRADWVFGPEAGFYCGYAFALTSANRAGLDRIMTWVSAEYELTDNVDIFADILITQNESFGRYAPSAAPGPTIPGDPRNDIGATFGWFRWVDLGTRDNTVTDNLIDINIGIKGDTSGSISWEAYYTYSEYKSASPGNYYLSYAGLEYNIANDIDDFDTFIANMKHTTMNEDVQTLEKVFAGMQFDMFELSGGAASAYVGAEHFKIDYSALVDAQSEAGLIGGSAGNSAVGKRDVTALTAEAIFPVTDWLELDAAVRYDDYSDFGSTISPRLGAIMNFPGYEALTLKASYGQGFRAPNLSNLFGATAFSASSAIDYYGCQLQGRPAAECYPRQFDTYYGSNPDLDAETSETWSIGANWTFAEQWLLSVNYFNLTIEDLINNTNAQDQLDVDYNTGGNNPAVQRNSLGGVVEIAAGYQNGVSGFTFSAVDFALSGVFETGIGEFGIQTNASYYIDYDEEVSYGTGEMNNAAGTLGVPHWRANALLSWYLNDWFASLNWDYIGSQKSEISGEKWDDWYLFNLQAGYSFDKYGTVTLGVNNLLDEDPILDDVVGEPVAEYMYDQTGRVCFIKYRVDL